MVTYTVDRSLLLLSSFFPSFSTSFIVFFLTATCQIMLTASDTRVIDPEFAVYGPMGFDVGLFIGNLLLSFFSHEDSSFKRWLLDTVEQFWLHFESKVRAAWGCTSLSSV
jgi:5-methylthioribose kinase